MKLLIVAIDFPPNIKGGGAVFASSISKHLSKMGEDVTVVAPKTNDGIDYDTKNEINIKRVQTFGNNVFIKLPSFALSSRKFIKDFDGDAVLLLSPAFVNKKNNIIINFRNTRYGEYLGCKLSNCNALAWLNKLFIPFDRYIAKKAKKIIVFDKNMKHEVTQFAPLASSKIVLLPNCAVAIKIRTKSGPDGNTIKPRRFHL